jgi:sodium-dependent dicarboxylate transporter 2/3/5
LVLASLFLAEAMRKHGLTRRLALVTIVASRGIVSRLLFGLVAIAALFSMWVGSTATAAMLIPVVITLSQDIPALDPVLLVLPVTLATTFGYSLPSASCRMALMSATGIVAKGKMLNYGLIVTVASSIVLALIFYALTSSN